MKKLLKWLTVSIITSFILLNSISPVYALKRNEYFLSFLYSTDSRTFGSVVVPNTGRELKENQYSNLNSRDSLIQLTNNDGFITVSGMMKDSAGYLKYTPYTFPEFNDVVANQTDFAQASNVGNTLSKSINNAMAFILKPVSTAGREELSLELSSSVFSLATAISNAGYDVVANNKQSFKAFNYNEKLKWEMKQANEEDMKTVKNVAQGSSYKDYIVIKNYSGDTLVLPYAMPKGYVKGQSLYAQHTTTNSLDEITEKLSWGHVVYLSSEQLRNGQTIQNNSSMKQQDKLSKAFSEFLNNIMDGIISAFGLYDVEELMFNTGNRGATHYYGIMPLSWLNPVNVINLVATVLATIVIGVSIIRMLIKRNIASISASVRVELMDGVKDLFIVLSGIMMFMPALYIVLNFNNVVISAMRDMSPAGINLGLTSGGDFVGLVAVIMNLAFVFILIMLNITYIVRSITLAILIGFAPMFIALFAAGPAAKKISGVWLKELISNILMQTFNAAILLVYANIGSFGGLSVIERFALLISFIPLTKFFKSSLMNLGSGADAAADKTSGAFSSFATGLMAGALTAGYDGKSEKKGAIVPSGDAGPVSPINAGTNGLPIEDKKGMIESFKGKVGTVVNNVKAPGELGRTAKKVAGMGAGAALSLGSAATGGSPLLGNSAIFAGANSLMNQLEGYGMNNNPKEQLQIDEQPIVMSGSDLNAMGVSGFDKDRVIFNSEIMKNINENDETRSEFLGNLNAYNENPDNIENQAEALYKDNGNDIYGVKIEGVKGKTIIRKDPETQRVIATESTVSGFSKVSSFKPVMEKYTKEKEKVKETVENPES